jgi:phosphatidate cytidylyltransferase
MLRVRLATAGILLPLVILGFAFGPSWFIALFCLTGISLCVFEASSMLLPALEQKFTAGTPSAPWDLIPDASKLKWSPWILPGIAAVFGCSIQVVAAATGNANAMGAMALVMMAAMFLCVFSSGSVDLSISRVVGLVTSIFYGAMPWLVIWQLYEMGEHARYLFLVMAVTWLGDTGGYFGGRFGGGKIFGNRKLYPLLSPKKTWEGAISGLLLSVIGAVLANLFFLNSLGSMTLMVQIGVAGGIAGQLGDLVESGLKRFSGVKDSGTVFPGHGGFLDRVDGILFAAPMIWAILKFHT